MWSTHPVGPVLGPRLYSFGRQLDWSRPRTVLMPENYFLLDPSPLLLAKKGSLFWLSWQEMHHLTPLDAPGTQYRPDLGSGGLVDKQQFRPWLTCHVLREAFLKTNKQP